MMLHMEILFRAEESSIRIVTQLTIIIWLRNHLQFSFVRSRFNIAIYHREHAENAYQLRIRRQFPTSGCAEVLLSYSEKPISPNHDPTLTSTHRRSTG